jgi:hypothetical protein
VSADPVERAVMDWITNLDLDRHVLHQGPLREP